MIIAGSSSISVLIAKVVAEAMSIAVAYSIG